MRLLAIVCAALFASAAHAQVRLRLLAAELPPYTFRVPPATVAEIPGPGQGLVHEVVVEMAKRIGHPTDIEYLPWHIAQQIAQREPNVGILALTRSPERDPQYKWLALILVDDLVMIGGQGVNAADFAQIRERPVGVLLRSGAEVFLREQGFRRIEPAPEEWLNAKKLKDRRIDAWLVPRLMAIHAWREVGGDPVHLNIARVVRQSEIWLAGSKNLPEAEVERWRRALEQIQADGTYQNIVQKYNRLKVIPVPDEFRRRMTDPIWSY